MVSYVPLFLIVWVVQRCVNRLGTLAHPGFFSHGKISESYRRRGAGFQTFRMRPFQMSWETLVDIKGQLGLGFGTPSRDRFKVAALKFLQPAPLRLALRGCGSPSGVDP